MAQSPGPGVRYTQVDAVQKFRLGTRSKARNGNEYIYARGVASLVAGDIVAVGTAFTMGRKLATTVLGTCGVAMSAPGATEFGWVQVRGNHPAAAVATHSSGAGVGLFGSSTAGRATSTAAANAGIFGAWTAGNSVGNIGPVYLDNPVAHGPLS